jgi:hypothetical protein
MDWFDVLKAREGEIDGEREPSEWIDYMMSNMPPSGALSAMEKMLRQLPIMHARLQYGPELPDNKGLEHEMGVHGPAHVVYFARSVTPGGYALEAGYVPFADDDDMFDDHFLGPHPETGELTVLQIGRRSLKAPCTVLPQGSYNAYCPSLLEFFTNCVFLPRVTVGHPPRKKRE